MTKSIVYEMSLYVTSTNSRMKVGSRRLARSVDNHSIYSREMDENESISDVDVDTFVEILAQKPVTVKITFDGGDEQLIRVHSYFCFTPPSGIATQMSVVSLADSNKVSMFFA